MDTLFQLVSLQSSSSSDHRRQQQQQHSNNSFNSGRTSTTTSSKSSSKQAAATDNRLIDLDHHPHYTNHYTYHHQQETPYSSYFSSTTQEEEGQEECHPNHLYMDEDFSSSSDLNPNPNPNPTDFSLPRSLNIDFSSSSSSSCGPHWASDLLLECARAVAARDTSRVQQLMWMLNELSSPYGDAHQKLSSYFLQALFARLTNSGPRTLATLASASDRTASFDSTRRILLKFQELSPWSSFGHVAANGAILESFLDPSSSASSSSSKSLHILDLSNTFCTQWPTLLEALATRSSDDTPHLTITTVVVSPSSSGCSVQRVMKEIGARMEKFARLMGVPFKFSVVHHAGDLSALDLDRLNLGSESDQILAVNCVNSLHRISPCGSRRDEFIAALRRFRPRIVTVVEEEAGLNGEENRDEGASFLKCFEESLRFFRCYMESLDESFPKTSNERLALEREAGRAVMDLVGCPAEDSAERRESAAEWARRMRGAGFERVGFSDDVVDDVRALLRRYREGWGMRAAAEEEAGVSLTWKEVPVVWASSWRM